MDLPIIALVAFVSFTGCASLGGWISQEKGHGALGGFLRGLFLGPIGVLIEARRDYWHRPPVDQAAWHTYRSMVASSKRD